MQFAMVHGGLHGAWCWDLLKLELAQLGHGMAAVDLPCEDVTLGAMAQATVAADSFAALPDDLVLVAHSIGALVGALVPTLRPVAAVVFLCSPLPDLGRSLMDQIVHDGVARSDTLGAAQLDSLGRTYYSEAVARQLLFHDCSDDLAHWAFAQLRHQSTLAMTEVTPLESWPTVPYRFIFTTDDRQLNPAWVRRAVPQRLGTDPIELPGGHSPFLSRPRLLAETLASLFPK
jgi:pimeloyl-ACP methyl ester carboxylesterase